MATLQRSDNYVRLRLSTLEKLGAFHGDLEMPISELESVKYVNDPWTSEVMRGIRAPGTGFPFVIMLGTLRNLRGWKGFCAVYKRRPAIVLNFKSGKFTSWIVTADKDVLAKLNFEVE